MNEEKLAKREDENYRRGVEDGIDLCLSLLNTAKTIDDAINIIVPYEKTIVTERVDRLIDMIHNIPEFSAIRDFYEKNSEEKTQRQEDKNQMLVIQR